MCELFFVESRTSVVWTFSYDGDRVWRFSRMSPCQTSKHILLLSNPSEQANNEGWAVRDYSPNVSKRGCIVGTPHPMDHVSELPPCGAWTLWGRHFWLQEEVACVAPPQAIFPLDASFAHMTYKEDGDIAFLNIKIKPVIIQDDHLERVLSQMREVLAHLARQPTKVLFLHADAQDARVPCMRHIRRFLAFVQENGPEYFLVVRGSAIVIQPRGFLGQALIRTVKMVQAVFPSPWPERILPSVTEADSWLEQLAGEYHPSPEPTPTAAAPESIAPPTELLSATNERSSGKIRL
mmetsp:Transcript_68613/g.127981  ORF Transcript_68613/g.127981 Transcript_68613/m.127981 type:complete len:293 (+) Transcript_68613:143-1021(+)